MKFAEASSRDAWQPFTPPGVAAFAAASLGRLMLVQLVFAALAGISLTTFLTSAWFPTISEATQKLPENAYIRGAHLVWKGKSPVLLANNDWLALTVDLNQNGMLRPTSDLQVEFSTESMRFLSLAGYLDVPYPSGWIIIFNQPELGPWWNAWKPFLAAGSGIIMTVGLMVLWPLLASLYALPAGIVCRFVDHGLPLGAVWKLCGAAQLPGSLLMTFALLLYSLRAIDLVQWLFVAAAHLLVAWVYLFLAIFFLPRKRPGSRRKQNPFGR
jgi:hypothetical protein